jgi:hypothetical protein
MLYFSRSLNQCHFSNSIHAESGDLIIDKDESEPIPIVRDHPVSSGTWSTTPVFFKVDSTKHAPDHSEVMNDQRLSEEEEEQHHHQQRYCVINDVDS